MRPVVPVLVAATPPEYGETHLDYWGPFRISLPSGTVDGYIVLTNYRLLFVRAFGPRFENLAVQFGIPWLNVTNVVARHGPSSVGLTVNHLYFEGSTAPGLAAEHLAVELRSTIVQTRQRRLGETRPPPPPPTGPVAPAPIHTREIVREVVKVPCRYCGTLFELTDLKCPGCGASRKA
ncbi:MAG: hypothetical protein L3K23_09475 [Thermoplasmata archaeon]|nr:hypothetical protein [Thermoplasmata archaeon]